MASPLRDCRPGFPRKHVPALVASLLLIRFLLPWKLLLLHYKASADAQDNSGSTPLHLACTQGHEDVSGAAAPGCVCPLRLVNGCDFLVV